MIFAQACTGEVWSGSPAVLCPDLADGLRRRRWLLEAILSDLFGARETLRLGLIPDVLLRHDRALLHGAGRPPPHLRFYAADLVWCPDGAWRVAADRTAAPQNHRAAALFEAPVWAAFLPALGRLFAPAAPFLPSIPTLWLADPQASRLLTERPRQWAIRDAFDPAAHTLLPHASPEQRQSLEDRLHVPPWRLAATLAWSGSERAERHPITLETADDHGISRSARSRANRSKKASSVA